MDKNITNFLNGIIFIIIHLKPSPHKYQNPDAYIGNNFVNYNVTLTSDEHLQKLRRNRNL